MKRLKSQINLKYRFLICLLLGLPILMMLWRLVRWHPMETSFLDRWISLSGVSPEIQDQIIYILFVPLASLVVVFVRLTLGIRLLGPFRSILIAVAFQATGIFPGLIFLALSMASIAMIRPVLKDMGLPYFARVSVILGAVAGIVIATVLMAHHLSVAILERVAYFPIIVLCLICEGFARTLDKEGFVSAVWRGATTALLAVVFVLFTRIPGLQALLFRLPELLVLQIGCVVLIAEFFDFRLLKWLNPSVEGGQVGVGRPQVAVPDGRGSTQ